MTVTDIENEEGEKPRVVLACAEGEAIAPKAKVCLRALFPDQETLTLGTDRIKVLGKGKPSVRLGDTVEVRVIANP